MQLGWQALRIGGPAELSKALVAQATRAAESAKFLGMEKKSGK